MHLDFSGHLLCTGSPILALLPEAVSLNAVNARVAYLFAAEAQRKHHAFRKYAKLEKLLGSISELRLVHDQEPRDHPARTAAARLEDIVDTVIARCSAWREALVDTAVRTYIPFLCDLEHGVAVTLRTLRKETDHLYNQTRCLQKGCSRTGHYLPFPLDYISLVKELAPNLEPEPVSLPCCVCGEPVFIPKEWLTIPYTERVTGIQDNYLVNIGKYYQGDPDYKIFSLYPLPLSPLITDLSADS